MYEMIPGNVNIYGQYVYIYVYVHSIHNRLGSTVRASNLDNLISPCHYNQFVSARFVKKGTHVVTGVIRKTFFWDQEMQIYGNLEGIPENKSA